MSVFTNPADGARADADAYIAATLDLLGEREPREVLEETVPEIRVSVEGLPEERLFAPEAEGKWSAREVVQHLADSELVWAYRLRLVLAEERPTLTGYDQDAWVRNLGYADIPVAQALEQLDILRRANLRLLDCQDAAGLRRVGLHNERGEESVEHMVRLYAGHDLIHRRQLQRILSSGNTGG